MDGPRFNYGWERLHLLTYYRSETVPYTFILLSVGTTSYNVESEVEQIQMEIMTNGPVEVAFTVYADFPTYRSGELKLL